MHTIYVLLAILVVILLDDVALVQTWRAFHGVPLLKSFERS